MSEYRTILTVYDGTFYVNTYWYDRESGQEYIDHVKPYCINPNFDLYI